MSPAEVVAASNGMTRYEAGRPGEILKAEYRLFGLAFTANFKFRRQRLERIRLRYDGPCQPVAAALQRGFGPPVSDASSSRDFYTSQGNSFSVLEIDGKCDVYVEAYRR